jgi:hypothetical protein
MDQLASTLGVNLSSGKADVSPFDRPVPAKPPLSKKEAAKKALKDKKIALKKPLSKKRLQNDPKKDPRYQK